MPQKGDWLYWCVLIIGLLFPVAIFWVIVTDTGEIDEAELLGDDDDGDDDDDDDGGDYQEGDPGVGSNTRAMKVLKAYKAKLNRALTREAAAVIVVGGSLVLVGGLVGDGNEDDIAGDSLNTTTGALDDEAALNMTTTTTATESDDDGERGDGSNIIGLGGIILAGGCLHLLWQKFMDIKLDAGLSQYNYRLAAAYREMRVFVCSRCVH